MAITKEREPKTGERGFADEVHVLGGEMIEAYRTGEPTAEQLRIAKGRDPQLKAISDAGSLPLRAAEGRIEAHENDSGEKEFCEQTFEAPASEGGMTTPMADVISQMAQSGRDYGRAFFEIVVENRGPHYRVHKVAFRKANTCSVTPDRNGSFDGFVQRGFRPGGGTHFGKIPIGAENAFVYIRGAATNPLVGESAIATAYRAHVDKLKIMTLWREHLQQFALGIIVGTMPRETFRDRVRRAVFGKKTKTIRGGGRVTISEGEKIEILEAAKATDQFLENLRYLDRQIAVSVLAPQLTLGDGSTGSWALSRDQSDFYVKSLEADLTDMGHSLTNHLLAKAVRWNFGPTASFPTYVFDPLSDNQRTLARESFQQMVSELEPAERRLLRDEWLKSVGLDPDDLEDLEETTGEITEGATREDLDVPPELQSNLGALQTALQQVGAMTQGRETV